MGDKKKENAVELERVLTDTEIKRCEGYIAGDIDPPNPTAAYFVDKLRKLKEEGGSIAATITELNQLLASTKQKSVGYQSQYNAYARDLIEWVDRPRVEETEGDGNGRTKLTDEESRELLSKDKKPEAPEATTS